MGIFSQDKTSTNQTSYNQQQGISTRDVTGAQLTSGGGSVSSFGNAGLSVGGGGSSAIYTQAGGVSIGGGGSSANVTVNNNLDATALNTAAQLVNNAITATENSTQSLMQAFTGALSANSEHPSGSVSAGGTVVSSPQQPAPLTDSGVGIPGFSINKHDTILIVAGVAVAGLLLYGYFRHRHG